VYLLCWRESVSQRPLLFFTQWVRGLPLPHRLGVYPYIRATVDAGQDDTVLQGRPASPAKSSAAPQRLQKHHNAPVPRAAHTEVFGARGRKPAVPPDADGYPILPPLQGGRSVPSPNSLRSRLQSTCVDVCSASVSAPAASVNNSTHNRCRSRDTTSHISAFCSMLSCTPCHRDMLPTSS
jgi:hypothetical protein